MNKILPKKVTNEYKGSKIAYYIFIFMICLVIFRSTAHILLPDGGAGIIAGAPLDTYSEQASNSLINIFSQWGLNQLIMGFMYIIVLIRYKSLIPLMYTFLSIEWIGRFIIGLIKPEFYTVHTAPGEIGNYIFMILMPIMLILSLKESKS